ncbi:hypothetical protein L0F63_000095 [Massospora cicadina]|nr:hypothetical protein L0F63_000095 [Massospora cicadina]
MSSIHLNVGYLSRARGGTIHRYLRTASKGGLGSRLRAAVGISTGLEPPVPPRGLETVVELHGTHRVDPFGRLDLKFGAGKKYLDQELLFYRCAPHHRRVKLIRRELNQIRQQATAFINGGVEASELGSLLEVGGRYTLYFSEGTGCYARDPTRGLLKIPLFGPKDIVPLFRKVSFSTEAMDLWTVSKINASADLQYLAVSFAHPHHEVGPLFLLRRASSQASQSVGLSGGSMDVLHFAERAFNFVLGHDRQRGATLLYTIPNPQLRPYRVMLVSGEGAVVREVYTEGNSANFVDIGLTRGQRFVTVNSNSLTTSEIYLLDLHDQAPPQLFHKAVAGVECFIDHLPGRFLVLANLGAGFQLFSVPESAYFDKRSSQPWGELASPLDLRCGTITDVEAFSDHLLIYSRDGQGDSKLNVYHWETNRTLPVEGLPEICTLRPAGILQVLSSCHLRRQNFASQVAWVRLSTPLHPPKRYCVDLASARLRCPSPGLRDPLGDGLPYPKVGKVWTSEGDGRPRVPITTIATSDASKPVLLVAYGAYGINLDPEFREFYLPLLRRGWGIALVHARGGGELGPAWYTRNRQDGVADVLAAARHFGRRPKAILGVSAGAVAVAGAVHAEPGNLLGPTHRSADAFQAMVLRVPFLDVVGGMLDPAAPLTEVEYLEWGDIRRSSATYHRLVAVSPYETVPSTRSMPAILVTAGAKDLRADPNAALRYIARWRAMLHAQGLPSPSHQRVLINVDMTMGHRSVDSQRYDALVAQEVAVIEVALYLTYEGHRSRPLGSGSPRGADTLDLGPTPHLR